MPFLAVVFPVDIPVAIEGGLEIEGLREAWPRQMVVDHSIAGARRIKPPMPPEILIVVDEILADDSDVRMEKEPHEGVDDPGLMLRGPVAEGVLCTHQGDAKGFKTGPGEAETGSVPPAGFDIKDEGEGALRGPGEQVEKALDYVAESRSEEKVPLRAVVVSTRSLVGSRPLEVVNDNMSQVPLSGDCIWMVSRNDLGLISSAKK
jgi:hypothetical protein